MSDEADSAGFDTSRSDESTIPDPESGSYDTGPRRETVYAPEDTVRAPKGFGARFANSFGALIAGIVLVPLACLGLFWNEGHAIHVARALDEVQRVVRTIPTDRLDPANNGQAVHVAGQTTSARGVADEAFGVRAKGLRLARHVEMYQWKEKESGSGNDRKFTYTREWHDSAIGSSGFHAAGGHQNPAFPAYRDHEFGAADARVDAVPVGAAAVLRLGGAEAYSVTGDEAGRMAARRTAGHTLTVNAGRYYVGDNPDAPRIGDVRISYKLVPEGPASFIGRQQPSGLEVYRASNGEEILLAYPGVHPADAVVGKGQDDNRLMTWIWRVVGLVVLGFGFFLLFAPVNLLMSYVPLLGSVVEGATFLVAGVATLALGSTVIALAWVAYRPLLAGGLIAGAAVLVLALRQVRGRRRPAPAALAPA